MLFVIFCGIVSIDFSEIKYLIPEYIGEDSNAEVGLRLCGI